MLEGLPGVHESLDMREKERGREGEGKKRAIAIMWDLTPEAELRESKREI